MRCFFKKIIKKFNKKFNENLTTSILLILILLILLHKGCKKIMDYKWTIENKAIAVETR